MHNFPGTYCSNSQTNKVVPYSLRDSALAICSQLMAKVYWKMRESGVIPNIWTFEMLIWGYSELKQSWKAEEVLHMMQENHLPSRGCWYD
jgi:hypothetical protein